LAIDETVAELEGRIKDPNFLGTVALAGASDLEDAMDNVLKVRLPVLNRLVAFWICFRSVKNETPISHCSGGPLAERVRICCQQMSECRFSSTLKLDTYLLKPPYSTF